MAHVTIYLDDDLYEKAVKNGISVWGICERAVTEEVNRVHETRVTCEDAPTSYARGVAFGRRWATELAAQGELDDVTIWMGERWRQFSLIPGQHSLPFAYCEEHDLDYPRRDQEFWFVRGPFTEGMVTGVAEVAAGARQPAP